MKAVLLAVGAGLCWGIGEVCTRSALHGGRIGPIGAITVRSLVAVPLLLLVFWLMTRGFAGLRTEPALSGADGATWAKVTLGSGLVAGGLAMVLFYSALSLGEVSVVKPIAFSVAPAVGVLLGWLILGEAMDWRKAAAVGLILAGVVLLTTSRPPAANAITPSPRTSGGMGGQPG
jgi:drug/metabolite transporter (DMT)-like permease